MKEKAQLLPQIQRIVTNEAADLGHDLWAAKKQNILTQKQQEILKNRVNLLKSEEKILWKKIQEDQKRVNSLMLQKEELRRIKLEKLISKSQSNKMLESIQTEHREHRLQQGLYRTQFLRALQDDNRRNYVEQKAEQIENEKIILRQKNNITLQKQLIGNAVREDRLQGALNIKQKIAKKEEKYKLDYMFKIKSYESQVNQTQEQVKVLEAMESSLLERLKNTKTLSQSIEGQLKDILITNSAQILDKVDSIKNIKEQIKSLKNKEHFQISQSIDETIQKKFDNSELSSILQDQPDEIVKKYKKRKNKHKKKKQSI